jgi:hypothetical protein
MKRMIGDNMGFVFLRQQAHEKRWVCIYALQWNLLRGSQARDAYPNG